MKNRIAICFTKLVENAKVPEYAHRGDSGADLYTVENFQLDPGEIRLTATGIRLGIPEGLEGQVRPKSGLALKGLSIVNSPATIDSGYRGEILVPLINLGKNILFFDKGDKIAQIVFVSVWRGYFDELEELSNSSRGTGGFGSTGG